MKTYSLLLVFIFCSVMTFSQEENQTETKRKFEIGVLPAPFFDISNFSSVENFRKLAPESELLKSDFSRYESSEEFFTSDQFFISGNFGIRVKNKKETENKKYKIRVGMSYFSGNLMSRDMRLNQNKFLGSGYDNTTGLSYQLDSVYSTFYYLKYENRQIRLESDYIVEFNNGKSLSFYFGLGIFSGFSYLSSTTIHYSKLGYTKVYYSDNTEDYQLGRSIEWADESFRNKNNFAVGSYVPIGINLILGKRDKVLRNMILFYEIRPAMNFTFIAETGTQYNYSKHSGIGLKYRFRNTKTTPLE